MAGANLFNRLSFSFDTGKFGDAIFLSDSTRDYLNTQPVSLETWQKDDLANGTITTSSYYKNPVLNVCNQLMANTQSLYALMLTIDSYDTANGEQLATSASTLLSEITAFKNHTACVSGVTRSVAIAPEDGSPVIEFPDYDKSIQLGQELLMLLNNTDGIQDSSPVLGNMTSLFIEDEIASNTIIIAGDYPILEITLREEDVEGNVSIRSNISVSSANTIVSHLQTASQMLSTRRLHDWNFYRQGLVLIEDYSKINRLGNVGNTQTYLINNLIGTDEYKQKISANT